ncbi:hypothetical protein [Lentzea californiensis]|uniref:hypothetical protein n=1 Tax=Lentzea californiensis TaxID=438851 RepID=UPI00216601EE|nr:hypothetical protein [Lentzea californiensis]
MDPEVERLARVAAEYREAGHDLVQSVALLVDRHPALREEPLRLHLVIHVAFGLSISDAKSVISWVQGAISREQLEEWLHRIKS